MQFIKAFFAVLVGLLLSGPTQAAIIPVGVQHDVPLSTVTGTWGWTLIYQGNYGAFDVPVATAFAGAGNYLMLAAMPTGSTTISLLAAASTADVTTYTPLNATTTSNGAQWYFNGFSLGFAGLGELINQASADTLAGANRLSWHTGIGQPGFDQDFNVPPLDIDGGYRAGDVLGLNNSTAWQRLVFTISAAPTVPEPGALVVWSGISLLGMLVTRVRRRRS